MNHTNLCVVILHHGETDLLAKRLPEISQANEIIVLEDPSTFSEQTKKLAKQFGAKVFEHQVSGDFAAHRNSVFSHIKSEWTLFLDQDESVSVELWQEIRAVIQDSKFDSFSIPRRDIFLGQQLRFGETGNISLVRLALTAKGKNTWERAIHETWNAPGQVGTLSKPLIHRPHASIQSFLQKLHTYAALEPGVRVPLSQTKVLWEVLVYPVAKLAKAIIWQQGWRDGVAGWIHAFLMAYYSLIVRVFCWEAWHGRK